MKPKWIVRIVVGVLLIAALVLGLIDYRAKSAAQKTADDWNEIDLYVGDTDVPDFEAKMYGDPVIKKTERERSPLVETDYIWHGTLRSYRVQLVSVEERGQVLEVNGPFNE